MKRILGLDIVRSIAVLFVVAVHFFLNTCFYNVKITGIKFLPFIYLRTLFFCCIGLFLIITGYLKKDKQLSKDYYKDIKKILISYFFISIICVFFNKYYLHNDLTTLEAFLSIFNFTADGYAWYIKMYIGLFLLIPFLNILYNNLKTKKQKQALIITLAILVSLPSAINFIEIKDTYITIIPNWWQRIFPILYYYIGCYIKEYQPKYDKKKLLACFTGFSILIAIILYVYNKGEHFSMHFFGEYGSLPIVILATLIFIIFYDVDIKNKIFNKIITSISLLSLDIYLFSHISDSILYNEFNIPKHVTKQYLYYFIFIVPLSFIISYLLAYIKKLLFIVFDKIKNLKKKKNNKKRR